MPLADAMQTGAPKGGPADRSARNEPGSVRVVAPARLHLGFLDLNGGLGRLFGSIGLAIDTPRTELVLKRARAFKERAPTMPARSAPCDASPKSSRSKADTM